MVYKGDDLELLTPDEWASAHGRFSGARRSPAERDLTPDWLDRALLPAQDTPALWVDGTVLGCCNKAYDLAVVHNAGHVGLEHLVHAMTLDVDAIDVLRSYDIDVTSLRMESAARLAAGRTSPPLNGRATLSNTEDFNGILMLAADRAYQEGQPVTIAHILEAMFAMSNNTNQTAVSNFLRNNPSLRYTTAPGSPAGTANGANGLAANPVMKELGEVFFTLLNDPATRADALQLLGGTFGQGGNAQAAITQSQPPQAEQAATVPQQTNTGTTMTTTNGSLDPALVAMLNGIRDKVIELKNDDKSQQGELESKWNDTVDSISNSFDALSAAVTGQLGALDATTLAAFKTLVTDLKQFDLDRKFKELEVSLAAKVGTLSSAEIADLKTQLTSLQTAISNSPSSALTVTRLETKLADVEKTVDSIEKLTKGLDDPTGGIAVQLSALQTRLLDEIRQVRPSNLIALESEIEDLKKLLKNTDFDELADSGALSLLDKIYDKVGDTSLKVEEVSDKVAKIEKGDLLTGMITDMPDFDMSKLAKLVAAEMAEDWSQFKHKMDAEIIKLQASLKSVDAENDARYDALLKLNQNQQALATAVDRLRTELHEYNSKATVINTGGGDPKLAEELRELKELVRTRQDFWTRFRYWLYGTDDWYAASWGRRRAVDLETRQV